MNFTPYIKLLSQFTLVKTYNLNNWAFIILFCNEIILERADICFIISHLIKIKN